MELILRFMEPRSLHHSKLQKKILTDCVPLALGRPRPFFSTAVDPSSDIFLNLICTYQGNSVTNNGKS